MKRIIAIILAALFVVVMLASCSAKGKYVISKIDGKSVEKYFEEKGMSGTSIDPETFMTFELKSGNEAKITMMGFSKEGTWKQKGNKVTITIDGDDEEFTLKGKQLIGNEDGEEIVLKRK